MKKTVVRVFCLVLCFALVFSIAGCNKKNTASFNESTGDFNLDFGENNGGTTSDGGQGEVSLDEKATSSSAGKTKAATIPNADSLSFSQLVSQMPSSLRGSTLTFYNWNPIKEFTGAEAVITNFQKLTGIKVNWVTGGYDDYDAKIAAMINAGNSPDLIRFRDGNIHRMYLCQDIKSATGYDFSGDIWDKKVLAEYTVKGKIYAANLKNTLFNQPMILLYRKSMFEKYKLEDPYALYKNGQWTWTKFTDMLKQIKELSTGCDPWRTNMAVDYLYLTGNTTIKFDGNQYINNLTDPALSECIKVMCNYRKSEYTTSGMRLPKDFEGGNIFFMTYANIATRKTNAWMTSVKAEGDLYCVPFPSVPGYDNVQWFSEIEAYGIPKGAKNAPATYYFLRYFLDADNYDTNTFFCNKQAYDVYKACMAKDTYFTSKDTALLDIVSTGGNLAGLSDFVRNGGDFAQFNTERDSLMPTFNLAVKKANEVLAKMP